MFNHKKLFHMRKTFLLQMVAICIAAFAIVSCEKTNGPITPGDGGDSTTVEPGTDSTIVKTSMFDFEVLEIDPAYITAKVTPDDQQLKYFWSAIPKAAYEGTYHSDITAAALATVNLWKESFADYGYMSFEEMYNDQISTGTQTSTFGGYTQMTELYLLAFGVDETGTLTQTIKNNPELLKDGIMETVSQYTIDQESGKTDALLYRKETGIDGKEREFSQSGDEEVVEKRDGYTVTTKWHENGKTSTVQDGDETHTIEYDKDGNTYVYVKNGETFKATAERLLGKDASEDQISAFRELNKDLIKTYGKDKKVEAFNVGEKIRVPMELQYNADTKAILTVDPKAEIDAWKKGVKPSGGSQSGETPIGENPIDETPIDIPDGSKIDAAAAKPVTLDVSKKQLDEKGIKYNVKGNELSFVDKQGRKVVMSYENGLKKHETAYPDDAVNMQGEQLTGRRYYDKVYENGVLKKEMIYHDTNPSKIAIQRGYKDGVIYREVKCMDDEQKNIAMAERMNAGEKINAVEFMHTPQLTERSEFVNGEKVKTIHYRNGDLEKIDTLETFKDGYTTTTVYENGDTSKILSIATTYPDYSNVVLKRYEAGNLDVVTELSEMNSKQNFTPVYDNKGNVVQYTKADGTVLDANGNLKSCELADNLYRQLKGYSDNDITEQMLGKIDESNIVDVLEGFERHSPDEPLFEYVNNEWGFGLGRPVMDPILGKLLQLGSQYGITNTKLQELLNNNKDNERSSYNNDEIKQLNENIPLVVKALRNKYKALIKENM